MKKRDLILFSNRPTDGGRLLADKLNARYLRERRRIRIKRLDGSLIVNWGSNRDFPEYLGQSNKSIILNRPEHISRATSKVRSYEAFQQAGIPTFELTTSHIEAAEWASAGGYTVLGRRDSLSGGRGINIFQHGAIQAGYDFYTKYYPKTHEYRVHVFRGKIIDVTQKRRRTPENSALLEDANGRTPEQRIIRSLDNGWVHCHDGIHLRDSIINTDDNPDAIGNMCIRACSVLSLDFGAIDLLVRCSKKDPNKIKDFRIAEVNTAPGLLNEATLEAYKKAILEYYEGTKQDRYIPRIHKVRKLVRVQIITRKGNKVWRDRYRYVSK